MLKNRRRHLFCSAVIVTQSSRFSQLFRRESLLHKDFMIKIFGIWHFSSEIFCFCYPFDGFSLSLNLASSSQNWSLNHEIEFLFWLTVEEWSGPCKKLMFKILNIWNTSQERHKQTRWSFSSLSLSLSRYVPYHVWMILHYTSDMKFEFLLIKLWWHLLSVHLLSEPETFYVHKLKERFLPFLSFSLASCWFHISSELGIT